MTVADAGVTVEVAKEPPNQSAPEKAETKADEPVKASSLPPKKPVTKLVSPGSIFLVIGAVALMLVLYLVLKGSDETTDLKGKVGSDAAKKRPKTEGQRPKTKKVQ